MRPKVLDAALAVAMGIGVSAAALAQTAAPSTPAKSTMTPPVVAVNTTTLKGKVTAIDNAKRMIAIQDEKGRLVTMHVGANVPNFGELKVGDQASIRYTEALGLALAKGGTNEIRTKVEADAARVASPAGDRPGMSAVERTTIVANVFNVDREHGILTVRGTDGVPVDIKVPDKQALAQLNKGDQLVIGYRQAAVVSIDPAAKR